jgi:hypothetical protein
MMQPLEFLIQSSILDRQRKLTLHSDYIEFEDKDLVGALPTRLQKNEISGFRCGIKWIQGYQFNIGRIYCIDIQDRNKKTIKLRLKTIYGIRKKILSDKYVQIINALYDHYFDDITRNYLEQFSEGKSFEVLGVMFRPEGVMLNKESGLICWEDLGSRSYISYYSLFSKQTPTIYATFEYINHWNVGILYSVSRKIMKQKELWSE